MSGMSDGIPYMAHAAPLAIHPHHAHDARAEVHRAARPGRRDVNS